MSTEHENLRPENGRQVPERAHETEKMSPQRRRAILRGLSKGAAIAGAAVPLQSLAGAGERMKLKKNSKDYVCSVSGQMSVLSSAGTGSTTQCIVVKQCSHFTNQANWPDTSGGVRGCQVGATFWKCTDKFKACFNSTTTVMRNRTLLDIVTSYATSDEAYWILAVLNARMYSSSSFPYTPEQVYGQFGSAASASALALHKSIVLGV